MELVNPLFIQCVGKAEPPTPGGRILSYQEAKSSKPVLVDDDLKLHPGEGNETLWNTYMAEGVGLVPVRRQSLEKKKEDRQFPARVLLELTSKCNIRCTMCPRTVLERPNMDMPKETAKRMIDEMDEAGVEGIWLYNIGESILHPEFEDIFRHCESKEHLGSIWLSSNGQVLPDKTMDMLLTSKLKFLNYSLNSMNAVSYKEVSPEADYMKTVKHLGKLLKKKKAAGRMGKPPWVRIQMIDQPQVAGELDEFLQEYGLQAEMLSINILEAFSQTVKKNNAYAQERERGGKRCNRIDRGDCFIFADGEVSFCDTDFNHKMSIGSIEKDSIRDLWNGAGRERYKQLNEQRRLDEVPLCKDCLDYDL